MIDLIPQTLSLIRDSLLLLDLIKCVLFVLINKGMDVRRERWGWGREKWGRGEDEKSGKGGGAGDLSVSHLTFPKV